MLKTCNDELDMETLMKRLLTVCLLVVGMAVAAFGQTVMQMGMTSDENCNYSLFYSYYTFNGFKYGERYYATITEFYKSSVIVPATIEYNGQVYSVCGISDAQAIPIVLTEQPVKSLTFMGDVTMWGNAIKVPSGMYGFNLLRFKGRSFPFDGDISNYFDSSSLNNVNVHLSDKTKKEIAELRKGHPWDQFYTVSYDSIQLNLTTHITLCPQTNYTEDVALYSLNGYESFADANYDLNKLVLMNWVSPGVYEINKYEDYVLIARYNKYNVDCQFTVNGYTSGLGTVNYLDYYEIFDVQTDQTFDLTFTWKTSSMNFIQVNGLDNIAYSIVGEKPMSGTLSGPLSTVVGASNGDLLRLTIPATATHTLDKVVLMAGDTEQTIAAPAPVNGNYNVNITVPTENISYIYVYWAEPEPYATFNFVRHGGRENSVFMMWDDGGVYDYYIPEGASQTTIPWDQLTTDMQMYIDVLPGETYKVYKDNVDITTQFNNENNRYEHWLELDKKSASYTIIYEPSTIKNIDFADAAVKAICVDNWDTNDDDELSYDEAAAVTDIGNVFKGNTDITSFDELQYFTGLTKIGKEAFRDAASLTSVVLPQSVVNIQGGWSFYGCSSLEKVVLPDNLSMIDSYTFSYTAIKSIKLPEKGSVTLGYNVFTGTPLTNLHIPGNLIGTIYSEVVSKCPNLISISVDEGNRYYDSREGCNAIIKKANNTLIASCKNTVIPKSVKALGDKAFFYNTEIKKLELPAGLESMGATSLFHCDSLTSIVAHMQEPFVITTANIQGLPNTCKLYVPKGKVSAYQEAGWTTAIFKGGIFEIEEPGILGDVNCDGKVTIADVTKLVNIILGKE